MPDGIGAVVIGRNEGHRLEVCLRSVAKELETIVYVDSGSTDGSLNLASRLGINSVELSDDRPFTAARARNAGVKRLREIGESIDFVQFIDGDCELQPGWLRKASSFLLGNEDVAAVCGRRRERYPEVSRYNRLCDVEWNTPVGAANACGGDSLMRLDAFEAVGGFSSSMIAGEEPDLCFRLRQAGWQIHRLDAEMTLHDAAMTSIRQWWQRSVRSGYAVAEAHKRRGIHEPELRRQVISNLLWALPPAWPCWPMLWLRVCRRSGALYASHIVFGKIPHLVGQSKFWWHCWQGRTGALIEYK
jgi:glycosyltransferase involved in cell wall biosynthesis